MKKDNKGEDMAEFKFVKRENELETITKSLSDYNLVMFKSMDKSGLSHFLKKTMQLLWNENSVCFYIDGKSDLSLSKQIIGQVTLFSQNDKYESNKITKLLRETSTGDIIVDVVTSCLYALDMIPFLQGIGSVANGLMTSIADTIDSDKNHIDDFKTEKAIDSFLKKIHKKLDKQIYLLIDDPCEMKSFDRAFLAKIISDYHLKVLFALNCSKPQENAKFISDMKLSECVSISMCFPRPDDELICALYECYGQKFDKSLIPFFDIHDRNIHIIMSRIYGTAINMEHIDDKTTYLLKVLFTINTPIPEKILFNILKRQNLRTMEESNQDIAKRCTSAVGLNIVHKITYNINTEESYYLDKYYGLENINNITYAEKSKIITDTIVVMDCHIESLSIDLLKFAIDNLEHDYSHSKKYILALMRKQVSNSCIEFNYLDKLNYFEDINELMYVCGIYYNNGIYDKPFRLLQIHKNFARKFSYKIANALVCERLHINKYVEQLEILVETTKCREKKCLLLAVLFVAYLNSDDSKKYLCFFAQLNKYYYKNYEDCENYLYLLRNISYYIDDVSVAVQNYEQCLYAFKLKDPVNYNRTVSNYLCYLMRHNFDNSVIAKLDAIAKETQEILEYNDEKYMYLNNNYGIYLMRYTCEDPSAYFSCIPYSTGTTETPYIYAQINLALYYEKVNPTMALYIMRDIQKLVEKTPVPRTKQFYNINLAMIEYSNGIFPQRLIEEIKNKPLRGNMLYAEQICTTYAFMNENNMRLTDEYRDILCLPGYLFYRYFDVKKLLFDF